MDIEGVAAIVTGGASGLGGATAEMLAAAGAEVTLFDMNAEAGEAQAKKIGGRFVHVTVSEMKRCGSRSTKPKRLSVLPASRSIAPALRRQAKPWGGVPRPMRWICSGTSSKSI